MWKPRKSKPSSMWTTLVLASGDRRQAHRGQHVGDLARVAPRRRSRCRRRGRRSRPRSGPAASSAGPCRRGAALSLGRHRRQPGCHGACKCSSSTDKAMLASSGERIPPCGVPVRLSCVFAELGEDPGLEERLHQRQHALVFDPRSAPGPSRRCGRSRSKARLDVGLEHPLVAVGAEVMDLSDRVLRSPLGPEPVGDRHESRPRRSVPAPASTRPARPGRRRSGCPALRSFPTAALGIIACRTGAGGTSRPQLVSQLVQEHRRPRPADRSRRRSAVDPGGAGPRVARDPFPRHRPGRPGHTRG